MLSKHLGLGITEEQRARWVQLVTPAADDAGLPSDPEFRSDGLRRMGHSDRAGQLAARGDVAAEGAGAALGVGGEAPPTRVAGQLSSGQPDG